MSKTERIISKKTPENAKERKSDKCKREAWA